MNVLFRADSSSFIGTGHIMRDLVLAKKYEKKSYNINFACLNHTGNINEKILEKKYNLIILKSKDKDELVNLIKEKKINLLIIDNYEINCEYEKYLKNKTGVKILSFDDTYEKHYCDILLNHNLGADKKKYKNLVPKGCKLKCGEKYTLLRDEFYKEKKRKKRVKNYKAIFIAMGGADHKNLNIKILKTIKKIKNIKVNLVSTNANKNLKSLKKYCKGKSWIKLHINSKKIAKLMRNSDLAIVTPSVTVNEVYFMKLPFIAIKTADNQKDIYNYLSKKNFYVLDALKKRKLQKSIYSLLDSKNKYGASK